MLWVLLRRSWNQSRLILNLYLDDGDDQDAALIIIGSLMMMGSTPHLPIPSLLHLMTRKWRNYMVSGQGLLCIQSVLEISCMHSIKHPKGQIWPYGFLKHQWQKLNVRDTAYHLKETVVDDRPLVPVNNFTHTFQSQVWKYVLANVFMQTMLLYLHNDKIIMLNQHQTIHISKFHL